MNTEQNDLLFDPNEVNEALKSAHYMDDLFKEGGALQLILKKLWNPCYRKKCQIILAISLVTQNLNQHQTPEMGHIRRKSKQVQDRLSLISQETVKALMSLRRYRSSKTLART